MTTSTWADLVSRNSNLIFKALGGGAVFVAPIATALPTAITSGAGGTLQSLPVGFKCLGWLDKSGAKFGRDIAQSNVNSWGAKQPTRIDIVSDVNTIQCVAQETNLQTLSLDLGCNPGDLVPDGTSGELIFDQPETSPKVQNRVFVIARDVRTQGEVYFAKLFPQAEVTARAGQAWQDGDDAPIQYDLTFTAFLDDTANTTVRHFYGGPGWKALVEDMGFALESSSS
jgi:hypothetical protein